MSDLISRQAAIDAMCSACGYDCDKSKFVYNAPQDEQVIMCPEHYALSTLPSAQPERKTGRWEFIGDNLFQCSCCGAIYTTQQLDNLRQKSGDEMYFADFCPNCGERKGR